MRDEFADGQLPRPVGVESVLEQEQHLDPHPTVLVAEGRRDLLEQLLGLDGGVHQLAEHDVGLLPDLLTNEMTVLGVLTNEMTVL